MAATEHSRERLLTLTRTNGSTAARVFTELIPRGAIESASAVVAAMRRTHGSRFQDERLSSPLARWYLLQEEIDFTVYVMLGFADPSLLSDEPSTGLGATRCQATGRSDILRSSGNEDDFPVPKHPRRMAC